MPEGESPEGGYPTIVVRGLRGPQTFALSTETPVALTWWLRPPFLLAFPSNLNLLHQSLADCRIVDYWNLATSLRTVYQLPTTHTSTTTRLFLPPAYRTITGFFGGGNRISE